jgi:enoyl-CoA hydratase/carnithine racemase
MTQVELLCHRVEGVQWVTFNRPEARNALTWAMYDGLVVACEAANEDPSIRAMVLTGATGRRPAFAAGTDISQFRSFSTGEDGVEYEARVERVMCAVESVRVPTVAAIAGPCTGGGAAIAACCDLRVASPSATFGLPMARTLGNCLSAGNYLRIVGLLGLGRARDLLVSGRLIDAGQMLASGVVSELVADEPALAPRAQEIAEEASRNAPLAVWATKESLRRLRDGLLAGIDTRDLLVACYGSPDFREGVQAFVSKREPTWRRDQWNATR